MALTCKPFGDIITFTRASTGTYFDSAGVLTSAAIDVPRFDYDPSTLAAQGLLIEEARTNLVLQSQDFATTWTTSLSPTITTNTTVAPDGTTTADTLASTAVGTYIAQIITFTGDGTKAYSFFIKAGTSGNTRIFIRDVTAAVSRGQVDIVWTGGVPSPTVINGSLQSLQACPNGWYRVSVIADSVVAANTNQIRIQPDNVSGTGNIIIWGFQAENGAFSTSYIPTTTTALTRSADVASVNTLSPWYNASAGTLYGEAQTIALPITNAHSVGSLEDAVGTERIQIRATASPLGWNGIVVDGVSQASLNSNVVLTTAKMALAYAVNDFKFCVNGAAPITDTLGTLPTPTALQLGRSVSTLNLNGWLRRLTYYPRALSAAELQTITA